jgi:MoaA/NifB/PqqE/SkfB family radical SAM enzyme
MTSAIQRILGSTQEGIAARNNTPGQYLPMMAEVLQAAAEERFDSAPAPLCVQVQVSAECTTRCTMCDHHRRSGAIDSLKLSQWQALFDELSEMGVKSLVLSGGEPLANPELPQLIEAADRAKLAVGLLTSGTFASSASEEDRNRCIAVIAKNVSWVAISVDGIDAVEGKIRTPVDQQDDRWKSLQHFTKQLLAEKPDLKLSATVTLQKANIDMDLEQACRKIQGKEDGLNIKSVFFKFATGSISALELRKPLSYLLAASDLQSFEEFLYNNALANEEDNNLKYLRRMFAAGFFSKSGITNGAPIADFYEERLEQGRALQCFTPFLFSLVDTDGSVYPCCHLYRDNHGENPNSIQLRRKHRMGNIRDAGGFKSVWNGKAYADERRNLVRINPNDPNYTPCGECTRHCRHNLVLTEVLIEYKQNPKDAIQKLGNPSADPVWF